MTKEHQSSGLFEMGDIGYHSGRMSWAHWVAALLASITGAVHVYLFVDQGFVPFLFAGVVFFAAVIALLLNVYRRLLYVLGVPFTAGQIGMWYLQGMPDIGIAMFDKPIQVVLILLLVYLFMNEDELTTGR